MSRQNPMLPIPACLGSKYTRTDLSLHHPSPISTSDLPKLLPHSTEALAANSHLWGMVCQPFQAAAALCSTCAAGLMKGKDCLLRLTVPRLSSDKVLHWWIDRATPLKVASCT